jgi:hypothetical protein
MSDNVQTLSVGVDMLTIGQGSLMAQGVLRYRQEGHEHE